MPPDLALPGGRIRALAPLERSALQLAGVWLALILLFAADWRAMALQWWDSSTYSHILLVPAIVAWLVWQRLGELRQLTPMPWWPALILLGGALLVWVLGSFAGFNLLRQTGAVAMLPFSALLLLGPRLGAALAFPLAYMAFLVPFGDELVPTLQSVTAELVIALTRLSGIPASIDGVFIDTPVGLFEVAEACSGVKFLIAMVALGTLAAHLGFRSWKRRATFMVLAVTAPILANGVRAWATIMAAQWFGAERASGFDHIVYGWVFFAIVIALVLGLAWRFFDRTVDEPFVDPARLQASPLLARLAALQIAPLLALALAATGVIGAKVWTRAAEQQVASLPAAIALPDVPGWQRVDYRPKIWWEPRASGADHRLLGRYAHANGTVVDVFVALYASQSEGKEAGGFGEGALRPDTPWAWTANGPAPSGGKSERLLADGKLVRLTETYYRTGPLLTGSNTRLKLANIEDRLLLRPRPTMLLILSAERHGAGDPQAALAEFRRSAGPLGPWMDRVAAIR